MIQCPAAFRRQGVSYYSWSFADSGFVQRCAGFQWLSTYTIIAVIAQIVQTDSRCIQESPALAVSSGDAHIFIVFGQPSHVGELR